MIESGFKPSHYGEGYILKKLLRICYLEGIEIDNQLYRDEILRQEKLMSKWLRMKDKHQDKPKEWWWNTHGLDLDLYK